MWLVATEAIPAGGEIRVNYEAGDRSSYWQAQALMDLHRTILGTRHQLRPLPRLAGEGHLKRGVPAVGTLAASWLSPASHLT